MKKWIKALRSGKYRQGQNTLKQFDSKGQPKHCCLGVLCELYNDTMKKNKKKTLPEKVINNYDFNYGITKFGSKTDILPKEVMKWSGIKDNIGAFIPLSKSNEGISHEENLADLNDSGRKFQTIANIIEKNYEQI